MRNFVGLDQPYCYSCPLLSRWKIFLSYFWSNAKSSSREIPYSQKFSREEIFAEEKFATLIFVILPSIAKFNVAKIYPKRSIAKISSAKLQKSRDRENKFREITKSFYRKHYLFFQIQSIAKINSANLCLIHWIAKINSAKFTTFRPSDREN